MHRDKILKLATSQFELDIYQKNTCVYCQIVYNTAHVFRSDHTKKTREFTFNAG